MTSITRRRGLLAAVILAALLALAVTGCGSGNDDNTTTSGTASATGNSTDRAFATEMIPHHESAVAMAKTAQEQSGRSEIKTLAGNIVRTQNAEIATLKQLDAALAKAGVEKGDLGLSESMMGMSMDDSMLMDAKPFDREFIDMMIPHHQGAIRMARVELDKGKSAELRKLAEDVVLAQSREISQMNDWRMQWYGAESPSGGVPKENDDMQGMSGMG